MPAHRTHTQVVPALRNCQVAQRANTQTKTCQRVWLPLRTERLRSIKHENTNSCLVHLTNSTNFEGIALNELCNGLTGSCFGSPNDTMPTVADKHLKPAICHPR
jgi:hypothetical protein